MAKQTDEMQYTECFLAFIDILGFSSLVCESSKNPRLLSVLTRALQTMADLPSGEKWSRYQDAEGNWIERRWKVQTRAFSDNIAIFMPVETGSVTQILFMVRYLHDRMLELGLCVRGAVTLGGMYWNDAWSNDRPPLPLQDENVLYQRGQNLDFPVTLGPALVDAHQLESKAAVYPRVLIGPSLVDHVTEHAIPCSPFGPYQPPGRRLTDFFRVDADGQRFLDLLHPDITRSDTERIVRRPTGAGQFSIHWERDGNNHADVTAATARLCDDWLCQRDCTEKIRAKYEWLKSYAAEMTRAQPTAGGH